MGQEGEILEDEEPAVLGKRCIATPMGVSMKCDLVLHAKVKLEFTMEETQP
jgi:hypothetical protein